MYWTDWKSESILRVNKFHGGQPETVAMRLFSAMDIHVQHSLKQPRSGDSVCEGKPCSHICLPNHMSGVRSATYTCHCPDAYVDASTGMRVEFDLKDDGLTCQNHTHPMRPWPTPPSGGDGVSRNTSETGSGGNQVPGEIDENEVPEGIHPTQSNKQDAHTTGKTRDMGMAVVTLLGILVLIFVISIVIFIVYKTVFLKSRPISVII